ncbi:Metallo-dependent phosphatase-like protein [Dimargaris cristalligena]|uniref:Metallo-dependent phosphatase-like protein n=1 Tax=Dimargaris cristalligena TaxID=215637 RepID=A0A4P9ZSP4_9FUNG|nr:Metallo-dependent phosphatase-like protein [Dimargaris cristalligena]|eukprot:RKP36584.1 Metallo-dependent phosphatase-like protein [Dimargaris cristalligena]
MEPKPGRHAPRFDRSTLTLFQQLDHTAQRYILVGDVHGQLAALNTLLETLVFNPTTDQVIFLGDMVNKGPDSKGVLKRAREIGARCIRGNHEDFLYSLYQDFQNGSTRAWGNDLIKLVKDMDEADWEYLDSCALVLKIPLEVGNVIAVHAGMDTSVSIKKQDPDHAMYIPYLRRKTAPYKYYDAPKDWQNKWAQKHSPDGPVVVYGHDEYDRAAIMPMTKGIDTTCRKGGKLTAIVYPGGKIRDVQCTAPE